MFCRSGKGDNTENVRRGALKVSDIKFSRMRMAARLIFEGH